PPSSLLSDFFSFNSPPTPEIYPLSLHDALPICVRSVRGTSLRARPVRILTRYHSPRPETMDRRSFIRYGASGALTASISANALRSEEHTSELQSRENLVCRLLLEKKK